MAMMLLGIFIPLLIHGCLSSLEQTDHGCMRWTYRGTDVCCDACHPGNRLVTPCGADPKELCTPCEAGTFTVKSKDYICSRCTQCVGAQVLKEQCTATTDTVCGCRVGLKCGDHKCSFCVQKCGKGEEPTEKRTCRPCPDGTFNDQIHQKCKPWSTKCHDPDQSMVVKGDAFSDIKCVNVSRSLQKPNQEQAWPSVLSVLISAALMAFFIITIAFAIVTVKISAEKRKKMKKQKTKIPIITPTDDPRTLIPIECSFHEAQQEQGRSTESLESKDSGDQLIS
ncbi:tumor necrosis factor receptor superfamily member 9a isoform 1-T1 [Aulostomus maculatus]